MLQSFDMHCIQSSRFVSAALRLGLFILAIIFTSGFFANSVFAQDTAGVGITPAMINERLDPGEVRQFTVQLTNLSTVDKTFHISTRDIVGANERVPIFARPTSQRTGYELSEWITLDRTEVFIPAAGTEELSFVMSVPMSASPGSHFGGVIISVEPPEIEESGASIGYEVANIIHIRISGEANDAARIREFSTSRFIYGKTEVEFTARVENEGNTLVTPTGPLEIFNMFGEQVAVLQFNESLAGVYPKTPYSDGMNTFSLVWQDDGLGFGRYEAILSLVYGDEGRKNTISSTLSFWILPMNIILPAVAVLLTLLIIVYVAVRLYIRRSLAVFAAGSTRRLVRTRQPNQFPILLLFITMLTVTALFLIVLLLLFA